MTKPSRAGRFLTAMRRSRRCSTRAIPSSCGLGTASPETGPWPRSWRRRRSRGCGAGGAGSAIPRRRRPLYRTVVNLGNSVIRRRALERRVARFRTEQPADPDPVADLDLRHAIAALAPHKRACVVLRYLVGMTEVQTAQILGVSPGTVKSQTHKALRQLREYLAEPDAEAGQLRAGKGNDDERHPFRAVADCAADRVGPADRGGPSLESFSATQAASRQAAPPTASGRSDRRRGGRGGRVRRGGAAGRRG